MQSFRRQASAEVSEAAIDHVPSVLELPAEKPGGLHHAHILKVERDRELARPEKSPETLADPRTDLLAGLRPLRTRARRSQRQLFSVLGFQGRLPPAFEPPDLV